MITIIVGERNKEYIFNNLSKSQESILIKSTIEKILITKDIIPWLNYLNLDGYENYKIINLLSCIYNSFDKFKTLFIEYPEIYLHPRTQLELGDLALLINRTHNSVWITNSEHMILRLLRRIRETTEGVINTHLIIGAANLTKEDIKIIYAPQNLELRIDDDGDFIDSWPNGFFTERIGELF